MSYSGACFEISMAQLYFSGRSNKISGGHLHFFKARFEVSEALMYFSIGRAEVSGEHLSFYGIHFQLAGDHL